MSASRQVSRPPRILVVDDSPDNREMYSMYLSYSGFSVEVADDGLAALANAGANHPDLIVMDLSLPRMDGWEATRRIKADVATQEIPVLALTGHAHWTAASLFFLSLLSGLPIWTPIFGWMAALFGGLSVCRWLHPWAGVLFVATSVAMFLHWRRDMRLLPRDREWLRPGKVVQYLKHEGHDPEVGKYNGGQKLFFFATALGALGLLLSGVVLWFPMSFPQLLRLASILLHDLTFILFTVAIVFHIYLGTAGLPGTFGSMTRGTVTRAWARFHHPGWYRDVTGEESRRG